jgi:hypothetical protein
MASSEARRQDACGVNAESVPTLSESAVPRAAAPDVGRREAAWARFPGVGSGRLALAEALPRNAMGKVLKPGLIQLFEA